MLRLSGVVAAAITVALSACGSGVDAYLTKGPAPLPDPSLEKQRVVHDVARVSRVDKSQWGEHATFNEFVLAQTEPFVITDAPSITYPAAVNQWSDEYLVNSWPTDTKLSFAWSTTSPHMPSRNFEAPVMKNATEYFKEKLPSRVYRKHFSVPYKVYANPPADIFSPWPKGGQPGHRGGWGMFQGAVSALPENLQKDVEPLSELYIDDFPDEEGLAKLGFGPQRSYLEAAAMQLMASAPGVTTALEMIRDHQVAAQIRGSARYRLFAPKQYWNLAPYATNHPGAGQSSMSLSKQDMRGWEKKYPYWAAVDAEWVCDVHAGEALYVPPHWWRHMTAGAPAVDAGAKAGDTDAEAQAKVSRDTHNEVSVIVRAQSVSRHTFAYTAIDSVSVNSWVDPKKYSGDQINYQMQAMITMLASAVLPHMTDLPPPPLPNHEHMQTKWTASTLLRDMVHRSQSAMYPGQFDELYVEVEDETLKPTCSRSKTMTSGRGLAAQQKREALEREYKNFNVLEIDFNFDLDGLLGPSVRRMRDTFLMLPSDMRAHYVQVLAESAANTVVAHSVWMPHWLVHCLEWELDFFDFEDNMDDDDGEIGVVPLPDDKDMASDEPQSEVWKKKKAEKEAAAKQKKGKKKKKRAVRKVDSKREREEKARAKKADEKRKKKEEKEKQEAADKAAREKAAAEKEAEREKIKQAEAEAAEATAKANADETVDLDKEEL